MKKLLLASAAVVATSGVAAAQNVNITGDARFGLSYSSNGFALGTQPATRSTNTLQMTHRVRLVFAAERETNAGVRVGVWTRVSVTNANAGAVHPLTSLPAAPSLALAATGINAWDGSRIYVSAAGLTLTAGTADGAVASRVALYGGGLGFTGGIGRPATHAGYAEEGAGTNVLRADYTNSGFTISASYAYNSFATPVTGAPTESTGAFATGSGELGVSYSMSGITVGAGIREGGNWSVSAGYAQGAYAVGALVSNNAGVTNYRLNGTYAMGDITLGATYTRAAGADNYGLGMNYNLGGGASIRAAVGSHNSVTVGELGMVFSF
jgi:outer membrane protein OmpU